MDQHGKIIRDPSEMTGTNEDTDNEVNNFWWDWDDLSCMMDSCERYLTKREGTVPIN